jgi:acetyl esterase/lipase
MNVQSIKKITAIVGLSATLLAGSACTGAGFLNTITPSGSYTLSKDVVYGDLPSQNLDIYSAKHERANSPVLVFIHGGSWKDGSKGIYKFLGENFAHEGFTIVIPNYRKFPNVIYPEFVKDTAASVAWAAQQYPDRPLILIGHSAGAYNAMQITLDKAYLEKTGVDVCKTIAGTIGLAGPYGAFPMTDEPYITIFPGRHSGEDASVNHTDAPMPPLFLAIGDKDTTVSAKHNNVLAERVSERGGSVINKVYPGLNHTDMAKVLSRYFDGDSTLKDDMINFIDLHSDVKENYCQ